MIAATVVGGGFMGENHAHAIADHPSLTLDSVVDIDGDRAAELANRYGANTALTEYDTALDRADAAVIATPEPLHVEQANAALDRGIHLLLEKPITESLEDARVLSDRTASADVVTGVSFVLRYDPDMPERVGLPPPAISGRSSPRGPSAALRSRSRDESAPAAIRCTT